MALLVVSVKCNTILIFCVLAAVCFAPLLKCVWFLELQIICLVHVAKPFGQYLSLSLCTGQWVLCVLLLQGDPTGSGIGGQIP